MNFRYNKLHIDGKLEDTENNQREAVICPATGEVIAEIAKDITELIAEIRKKNI